MTARSLELIAAADVVYYDRLIPPGALDGARAEAELVYVGKQPGVPSVPQAEIGERLIEAARAGRSVVRLKGGDPFVFGRGGEEGEALREAGVEFEVVPGVTAGIAATAYAGIPVTHRDDASAVAFVTGHEDPEKTETALDWDALAAFPGTLVFYMGVKRLGENAAALIAAGRDPTSRRRRSNAAPGPASAPSRRRWGRSPTTVVREGIGAPALIVVGPVAARRERLEWLERRPLHGRTVVVTRARAQASGLAATLRSLGAEAVELPAIRVESRIESDEVRAAMARIGDYALVCLTSPNGVRLFFEALSAAGLDARALAGATVAAIGPGTARALAAGGIRADIVPERFVAEALVEALAAVEVEGRRVLVARAAEARDVLPDALRERGAEVDVVALYETVREAPDEAAIAAAQEADYVTFTSSSTVTNLVEALGDRFPKGARIVSIGPITSDSARAAGLTVDVEADPHDVDGLLAALLADAAGPPRRGPPAPPRIASDAAEPVRAAAPPLPPTDSTNTRRPRAGRGRRAARNRRHRRRADRRPRTPGPQLDRAPGRGAPLLGDREAAGPASRPAAAGRPAGGLRGRRGAPPERRMQSEVAQRRPPRRPQARRRPDRSSPPGRLGRPGHRPEPDDLSGRVPRTSSVTPPSRCSPTRVRGGPAEQRLGRLRRNSAPRRSAERVARSAGWRRARTKCWRRGGSGTRCSGVRSAGRGGSGVADGVDERGFLLVRVADGDRVALGAGEVHLTGF